MSEVKVDEDIIIGQAGDRDLVVDVLRPSSTAGLVPGILVLPTWRWPAA